MTHHVKVAAETCHKVTCAVFVKKVRVLPLNICEKVISYLVDDALRSLFVAYARCVCNAGSQERKAYHYKYQTYQPLGSGGKIGSSIFPVDEFIYYLLAVVGRDDVH